MSPERQAFLRTFADEVARGGLSYPGCGGGPATFPLESIDYLRPDYGVDIVDLCAELLLDYPDLEELVECTGWLAAGILLHLGDKDVLAILRTRAQRLLDGRPHLNHAELSRLRILEALVPALCKRLGQPLPQGFNPMDEQDEWITFLMTR